MTEIITSKLNVHSASQFVESITESELNNYYMFYSKHVDYDESTVPTPSVSLSNSLFQTYDEMIAGKLVTGTDVRQAIKMTEWANGTIYTMFDNQSITLATDTYYVVTTEGTDKHVWKCIDNNNGVASNSQPLFSDVSSSLESLYIKTGNDGYQWKFMYSVNDTDNIKFTANNYLPVIDHANASGNAINGSIDAFKVSSNGAGYNVFANGVVVSSTNTTVFKINSTDFVLSSNDDFYNTCGMYITDGTANGEYSVISDWTASTNTITLATALTVAPDTTTKFEITPDVVIKGDGSNAQARARILTSTNTVSNVQIISRGTGYTHATATVAGNNTTTAAVRPIIGPNGGHGYNPKAELDAKYVIVSTDFANNEALQIPTHNDFRTVGLIKDPMFSNVQLSITEPSGSFGVGNVVTHSNTTATGVITFSNSSVLRVTNASGQFLPSNSTFNANIQIGSTASANLTAMTINAEDSRSNSSYFQQTTRFGINMTSGGVYSEDESVSQATSLANGVVYFANSSEVSITSVRGTFTNAGSSVVTGGTSAQTGNFANVTSPDLIKGSGEVMFLKNVEPISRSNTSTESVKLVIQF